jgi:hypothetical protein
MARCASPVTNGPTASSDVYLMSFTPLPGVIFYVTVRRPVIRHMDFTAFLKRVKMNVRGVDGGESVLVQVRLGFSRNQTSAGPRARLVWLPSGQAGNKDLASRL